MPKNTPKLPPPVSSVALFKARFPGYAVGLLPMLGMLLLFRQTVPQWVALALTTSGLYLSILLQQAARKRFAYDFTNRGEWLALGLYVGLVGAFVVGMRYW